MRRVFLRIASMPLARSRALHHGVTRRFKSGHQELPVPTPLSFAHIIKLALICSASLCLLTLSAAAQSTTKLRGYVYDAEDGSPAVGAVVDLDGTNYHALTDNFGVFGFDNVPPATYTVTIAAAGFIGFKSEPIRLIEDITRQVMAPLERKTYQVPGITVVGRPEPPAGDQVIVINREQIQKTNSRSISELLESVPGVFVQHSGSGGQSQIRIRGAAPRQVLVLLDGQKVNPSASGVADLNTIPIEMVERIEVHKGGASAEHGPDALGGVINVITHKSIVSHNLHLQTELNRGRWRSETYTLTASDFIQAKNLSTRFACMSHQSRNGFDFHYTVEPSTKVYEGMRINNFVDSYNYFGSSLYEISTRSRLSLSAQLFKSGKGLPGRASDQNEAAFTEDERKLVTVRFHQELKPRLRLETQTGFSRFDQYFWDRDNPSVANRFESRYTNDIYTGQATTVWQPWRDNETRFGVQLTRDILNHSDHLRPQLSMDETVRDGYAAFLSSKQGIELPPLVIFDAASIDAALRYDQAHTSKDSTSWQDPGKSHSIGRWSPKVGATLSIGDKVSLAIRGSYGQSFRLPSINALFWKGDVRSRGNPNLRPEIAEHSEGGMEVCGSLSRFSFSAGVTYFHSYVTDLVVWQAGFGGVWTPVNLAAALTTGHEEFVTLTLLDELLELQYQNTITNARNRVPGHNSYNKQLTFTPHYLTTLSARFRHTVGRLHVQASYAVRMVDKRFALENNQKWYDAYEIHDLGGSVKVDMTTRWHTAFDIKLYNLTDEDYTLLAHYPMPGRHWDIGLRISYGVEGNSR
ncbi:MAG: TonB-dependent receptor [Candidatus Zixiibacteriota bacterium]